MLNFVYNLVKKYSLPKQERQAVDINSLERGGEGVRGYGRNKQGTEVGWWIHPERYRKELDWLLNILRLKEDGSILSIACGPAFHEIALASYYPAIKITATDLDPKEIETAQQIAAENGIHNINFQTINAEQIDNKFSTHAFDYVISLAALHDVLNLDPVFKAVSKILKKDGRFIFTYNPGRRAKQFPNQPTLEKTLSRYLTLIRHGPLITPEDALNYYGEVELKSRQERGYGLVQEARIATLK